ncbi:T9SS type B sorting domain-containing protein [Winogradskyella sp.]|nr:T9SS type B sorting domain-containing protein [Winogradskyella sp.]
MLKLKFLLIAVFYTAVSSYIYTQNPPGIVAEGNQLFCGESPMPIVTDVNISAGNGMLDFVYIQISTGYTLGSDILFLDGTHPNITANWSTGEGLLTLTGTANYEAFENAIREVKFQTSQNNFTQDKFFSINLGEASFLPATGHYYFYVEALGISWSDARDAAAAETYFGLQGYLATITVAEEVQLTGEQSTGTGWIGGSDRTNEGVWVWETGPEAGQVFWEGLSNGSSPNNAFSFWNTGEPNSFGDEDYTHITDPSIGILGSWNDLPNQGELNPDSPYHPKGYVVEFGGMAGDPDINISTSTVIVTPKVNVANTSICDEGLAQITVATNTDNVLWYASSFAAEVIHTGLYYETYLNETTTFWISPLFNGCNSGDRLPITVNVYSSPIANNITIIQCDDANIDGISSFNLSNYTDDIVRDQTGQVVPIWEVTYFEDSALLNAINPNLYINLNHFQTIYAKVTDPFTGCASIAEVILLVNTPIPVSISLEACDDYIEDGYVFFNLADADSQLLSTVPVNATITYYTSYNDALLKRNEISSPYFNETPYSQIIHARLDIDNNCYAINEVALLVKDLPNILQYEEVYYCLNNFPGTITLGGGITNDIPNNYAYNWSTGETTVNIDVNTIGNYTVLVTRPNGCTNRRTIAVLPSSTATIEILEVSEISENNTISVIVSGDGDYVYALDDEFGVYQESNLFENVPSGIYNIYIKDIKADCGIVSSEIFVLGFPKFFTPNGDAKNDTWQIKGFSSQFPITASTQIFNRYGKLITVLNKDNPEWNGYFNGEKLPSDDYWFVSTLEDGRTFKGHFTLKR